MKKSLELLSKTCVVALVMLLGVSMSSEALAVTHEGAVVILPLAGRNGISPYAFVNEEVEPALAGQVKVVDSEGYFRELRRQRLPVKKAFTKRVILKVAPKIGAKQALVLESTTSEQGSGRRRRKVSLLRAAMIDIEKGSSLFVYQWPLPNGAFSPRIARDLVRRVLEVLPERAQFQSGGSVAADGWSADSWSSYSWTTPESGGSAVETPRAEPEFSSPSSSAPVPVAQVPEPAVEETPQNEVMLEEVNTGAGQGFDVGISNPYEYTEPVAAESPESPVAAAPVTMPTANGMGSDTTAMEGNVGSVEVSSEPVISGSWFSLSLQGGAMQRVGYVPKPTDDGSSPSTYAACFCGPMGEINPMFASLGGTVDVFPFRLTQGSALAGFGLRAEVSVGSVTTAGSGGNPSFTSTVLDWDVGAQWEFALWSAATAPTMRIIAGYSSLTFPLESGPFPGLTYVGPSFKADGTLPVGSGFSITGGGGLRLPLTVQSDEASFGDSVSAWAWTAALGATYSLQALLGVEAAVGIEGRFMGLNGTLSGESTLPNAVTVVDASLVDIYRSVHSSIEFSF